MTDAIRARGVRKVYPKAPKGPPALDGVDLVVPVGTTYGLIGRNGAGKTTFVRICATQLAMSGGELQLLGLDLNRDLAAIRTRIACVPQESRPLYFVTVHQLVELYLRVRGMDRPEAVRRTEQVLKELDLKAVEHRLVNQLSGGLRRRAMVAMILATDAELVFLDEPTTGLDPVARREVWACIRRAEKEHRTVVLTTHYLDEAEALSARLALLEGGKVVLEGSPEELRSRVKEPYRVTIQGGFGAADLQSYGTVSALDEGYLVFATERSARELALAALNRGAKVSLAPATLEDLFLRTVGRRLDEDDKAPEAEGASA
jgi:ABC-2 type transport system ATP-binding protein